MVQGVVRVSGIGERLAHLRKAHGDSLREAAARCGLSHPSIVRAERGDSVDHSTLEKIARGYGVSIRYLVTGQDLAVEFREHLRSLTTDQWQPLIASKDNRLREVLRFLESRGEEEYSLAAVAGKAGVPRKVIAQFVRGGVLSPEQWERLATTIGQLLRRTLPDGWLRAGVTESDDVVGMVASTLSRVGRGMQRSENAGRC